MSPAPLPHVVIIGGGFGGLQTAQHLKKAPVRITLIDRNNHHLFQPLLYQVATAGMAAEAIAVPIRGVLRHQKNCQVVMGEVDAISLPKQSVALADGTIIPFDKLVIAAGARTNYFGNDGWAEHTVGLKSVEDASEIRRRVLSAFEAAEGEPDAERRRAMLTFVVIGGGPTGVELAGSISELSTLALLRDFRTIQAQDVRVLLLEMAPRLLMPFHPNLSEGARKDLSALGVEIKLGARVTDINATGVSLGEETIPASLVAWAAGVMPQSIAGAIEGAPPSARGFIEVEQDCTLRGHENVFAIGDIAALVPTGATRPLPGVAPVAMQQARHVASCIRRALAGKAHTPFKYFDKGNMAIIGKNKAVLEFKKIRMRGLLAWAAWLVVHVYYLIGFRSRSLVVFEWFCAYFANRRGARLITTLRPTGHDKARSVTMEKKAEASGKPNYVGNPTRA